MGCDFEPGCVLSGTYRIVRRVGAGGMGEVFEATHARLQRRFAIKTLRGVDPSLDQLQRFRREAELTSQLQHPNIVGVVDYNVSESGCPYYVMPFLEGESLGERLKRVRRLTLAETLELATQVSSALTATHGRGIVHRDLKPQNLFFARSDDQREVLKVLDFGVSKLTGSRAGQTADNVLLGSPRYMAPEQALGKHRETDRRADIFSLGAILYEALSGAPAFSGDSELEALHGVVNTDPTALRSVIPDLSEEVEAVVARALAKRPARRYQSARALVEDLSAAIELGRDHAGAPSADPVEPASAAPAATPLASGGTPTVPDGRRRRPPARQRRPRWLAAVLVAAVMLGAGAALVVPRLRVPSGARAVPWVSPPRTSDRADGSRQATVRGGGPARAGNPHQLAAVPRTGPERGADRPPAPARLDAGPARPDQVLAATAGAARPTPAPASKPRLTPAPRHLVDRPRVRVEATPTTPALVLAITPRMVGVAVAHYVGPDGKVVLSLERTLSYCYLRPCVALSYSGPASVR